VNVKISEAAPLIAAFAVPGFVLNSPKDVMVAAEAAPTERAVAVKAAQTVLIKDLILVTQPKG
jgi:hypothetical protein